MFGNELFGLKDKGKQEKSKEEKVTHEKSRHICIGLDHGNGFVKARSDYKEFIMPSLIAREDDFKGEAYGLRTKDIKKYQTVLDVGDDTVYAWGKDVIKSSRPIKTFATEDRYTKLPYNLLTKFAIAELTDNDKTTSSATIVTGCPSYEKGTRWEEDLLAVLNGQHMVNINGISKTIDVKQVKVLPQPLGTLMYYYLDEDGMVADDKFESDDYYCGVLDVGSGTTDLDGLRELQVQSQDRSTIRTGMFDAYDEIATYIKEQEPRADIDKEKVELWMRKRRENDENQFIYNPTPKINVDFTETANRAFKNLAQDIMFEVDQRWNKSHFNEIFLTGGGADVLGKHFLEWDRDIKIVENNQMANALGFYRYAKFLEQE